MHQLINILKEVGEITILIARASIKKSLKLSSIPDWKEKAQKTVITTIQEHATCPIIKSQ